MGLIVPKTTCDMDRTGTKGQQWAYCLERASYKATATERYQAKTTALIDSPSVSLRAAGGRTIMEALFRYNHPTPISHLETFAPTPQRAK